MNFSVITFTVALACGIFSGMQNLMSKPSQGASPSIFYLTLSHSRLQKSATDFYKLKPTSAKPKLLCLKRKRSFALPSGSLFDHQFIPTNPYRLYKNSHFSPPISSTFVYMTVTTEMIDNLAKLAKLQISEEDKEGFKKDLEQMIGFIGKLNELDTEGIEPLMHMSSRTNVFRDDVVQGSISREEALLNAPEKNDEFFLVPKVIKK